MAEEILIRLTLTWTVVLGSVAKLASVGISSIQRGKHKRLSGRHVKLLLTLSEGNGEPLHDAIGAWVEI